jgi:hypothetical protein
MTIGSGRFQLVCYTAAHHRGCIDYRGMTLISVLLTLRSRRGAWGHVLFSDGRLQQQAARAEAAELRATAINPADGK